MARSALRGVLTVASSLLLGVFVPLMAQSSQPVQAKFFGLHILKPSSDWPSITFGGVRTAGTSWAYVETARGTYNWGGLDSWTSLAQKNGKDIIYTFLNTPQWASSQPTQACYRGNVGCAAPPANYQDWDDFVTAVATRYKGKIQFYELWNEPTAAPFWMGTTADMVHLAQDAYTIIKSIDPAAQVLTPAVASDGNNTYIKWLAAYLQAGGNQYADIGAWHGYLSYDNIIPAPWPDVGTSSGCTTTASCSGSIQSQAQLMRQTLDQNGMSGKPVFDTEGGWGKNTELTDATQQAAYIARWYLMNLSSGVQRAYWYQWDNTSWGTLWDTTSGVHPAGKALDILQSWLIGATPVSACAVDASSTWTCPFRSFSGYEQTVAWNTSASVTYTPDSIFKQVHDLAGNVVPISGNVTVGVSPVLLDSTPAAGSGPVPSLVVSNDLTQPYTVVADTSATSDVGGTIVSRTIDFGDGKVVSNAISATHTYAAAGTYTITLTVTDSNALTAHARTSMAVTTLWLSISPGQEQVTAQQSASYTVQMSPDVVPVDQNVTLSCSGLPQTLSCSFTPAVVYIAGSPATATLTIGEVTASSASVGAPPPDILAHLSGGVCLLAFVFGGALQTARRGRTWRVSAKHAVIVLALLLSTVAMISCGGGQTLTQANNTTQSNNATTATTYQVVVTAKSTSMIRTTTATVAVSH